MGVNSKLCLRDDALLVWSDPSTLQLGVDRTIATFRSPSKGVQRILTQLRQGTHRSDLERVSAETNLSAHDLDELLSSIAPALCTAQSAPCVRCERSRPRTVLIVDPLAKHDPLGHLLRLSGYRVLLGSPGYPRRTRFPVISLERFFHDTYAQQYWLSHGLPVLPIRYSDASVHIGPILTENGTCGNCLNTHLAHANPRWKVIASQLIGRVAPTETLELSSLAVGLAVHLLAAIPSVVDASPLDVSNLHYIINLTTDGQVRVTSSDASLRHEGCRHHDLLLAS